MKIKHIEGFEVIDSRGNPTVGARVTLENDVQGLALDLQVPQRDNMKQMKEEMKTRIDILVRES